MSPVDLAPVIRQAHDAARGGDWPRVRALLDGMENLDGDAEGTLLFGEALLRTGHAAHARTWLKGTIASLERTGGASHRRGLTMLGAAYRALGAVAEAEHAWSTVVDLAHAADDALAFARATNNLGIVANMRGHHRAALGMYRLAIPAYQRLGNTAGLAESYHNMGISHRDESELDNADECEQRAIEYATSAANPWLAAAARLGRAEITFRRGDAVLTAIVAHRVAGEFAALADPLAEADATRLRGVALLATGEIQLAADAIHRAIATAVEYANRPLEAECQRALAELCIARSDSLGAQTAIGRAIELFDDLGARSDAEAARDWAAARGIAP